MAGSLERKNDRDEAKRNRGSFLRSQITESYQRDEARRNRGSFLRSQITLDIIDFAITSIAIDERVC
ncbi:hypothetical protein [Kineothrix sp. MB12-C1]|uniref:hypothetical protein n=1 Tax=Kineothrix sp. MB12-C1 TaxID=3070215 RepID=UPI0027D2C534|nr:hypothetical protein [Kineothrix sp. MB12-C1]WMC93787.1 hypothetical protein RBB56_05880 [Kineothrix sp. MB12-C1]